MFSHGLSLDQAPPLSVIMRFFLTIPFFGVLAAFGILFADVQNLGNWDIPQTVAIVHLLLIGVAAMAMIGALFQMLPVLAGAAIAEPLYHARWTHLLLIIGTLMITAAFYFNTYIFMHPAVPLLIGSFGFIIYLMLSKLAAVENKTPSVVGMMVSLSSLGAGLLLALILTAIFMGADFGMEPLQLRSLHLRFMLAGWIGTLVMAVSFQVIEMFYVTPPYPKFVRSFFPLGVLFSLLLYTIAIFADSIIASVADVMLALLFLCFSLVTLRRLMQRKRPVADATVWLWRTAMISLLLSSLSAILHIVAGIDGAVHFFALLFGYFVLSVIFAMSYKIVPFLVWFHLNAKGVLETPLMGDILPAKAATLHLWLHWVLGVCGLFLLLTPYAYKGIALLLGAGLIIYGVNILRALKIYNSLKDKGLL